MCVCVCVCVIEINIIPLKVSILLLDCEVNVSFISRNITSNINVSLIWTSD